jgi:hypothetical protein
MSGPDQGDQNKGFVARWSQRKREAKQPEPDAPVGDAEVPPEAVVESDAPQEFDLSSLPRLEDLTPTTDITAFLRAGVPEHLRNAALRKSWALDPAIRNYVNPALEYAYDWNTPGGVPGSSAIGAGMDVARLVSQIMGGGESAVEPPEPAVDREKAPAGDAVRSPEIHATQDSSPDLSTQSLRLGNEAVSTAQKPPNTDEGSRIEVGQAENSEGNDAVAPQQAARRHGSAKPSV